jgi:hypothetical protein
MCRSIWPPRRRPIPGKATRPSRAMVVTLNRLTLSHPPPKNITAQEVRHRLWRLHPTINGTEEATPPARIRQT